MKWRSVEEKPKIIGRYFALIEADNLNGNWEEHIGTVVAWLDPEVPEPFLRQPEPVKCCPWCGMNNWRIERFGTGGMYYYLCEQKGCTVSGPERETYSEAEAAIFERVR